MVIEYNAALRKLLVETLSPDYQVITAESGVSGLSIVATEIPALIISDVMMPGMDGYTLCKK